MVNRRALGDVLVLLKEGSPLGVEMDGDRNAYRYSAAKVSSTAFFKVSVDAGRRTSVLSLVVLFHSLDRWEKAVTELAPPILNGDATAASVGHNAIRALNPARL